MYRAQSTSGGYLGADAQEVCPHGTIDKYQDRRDAHSPAQRPYGVADAHGGCKGRAPEGVQQSTYRDLTGSLPGPTSTLKESLSHPSRDTQSWGREGHVFLRWLRSLGDGCQARLCLP